MQQGTRLQLLFIIILLTGSILQSCNDITDSGREDSPEFIRSVEPIEGAQNVTINLKDGHSQGALFLVDLSGIESNPYIENGQQKAWSIEWSNPAVKGEHKRVKLHATKGQALWRDVNYFLSQKENLEQEFPGLGWKESQIIIWSLVKHNEFEIDEIPNYQNFDPQFYKDSEYQFDVSLTKEIISQVKSSSQKPADDSFAIILNNNGRTLIIKSGKNLVTVFKLFKLNKYGLSVATDINDQGDIIGGNLYLKNKSNTPIDMGIVGTSINNNGQVVGRAEDQTFIWEENKATINIGRKYPDNLGQYSDEEFEETVSPSDINNFGEISGEVEVYIEVFDDDGNTIETDFWFEGFYWTSNDGFRQITSYLGTTTALNDYGQVVGMDVFGPLNDGFIWDGQNGMRELVSSSEVRQLAPYAINNYGQVVGGAQIESQQNSLTSTSLKQDRAREIQNLYSMTETKGLFHYSHVIDMIQDQSFQDNATLLIQSYRSKSKVLESSQLNESLNEIKQSNLYQTTISNTYVYKAFIWDENNGIDFLGSLGGERTIALDINDNGQVVGYGRNSTGEWKAFYWDHENGIIQLPDLGGSSQARAINNKGQIVGYSYDSAGQAYPVLWRVISNERKK